MYRQREPHARILYSMFRVLWVLALFYPIVRFIGYIMMTLGGVDPMSVDMVGANEASMRAQEALVSAQEAMKVATISGTGMSEAQAALSAAQADMSSAQHAFQVSKNAILYGIAALHTLFNVTNTLILIWFVPLIVKS